MGAGKTTLAKQISEQYGYAYIDTDDEIEKATGKSISELFDTIGEKDFRKLETDTLRTLKIDTNTIIATGGGLPCYNNNMEWMNENGITIYLKHSIEELKKRLEKDIKQRPLLKSQQNLTLSAHIEALMSVRSHYYEQAKFVILGNLISPQTVINTTFS